MENKRVLHVVMFPWLAMGHLIPFLHLSKYLARKGHHVSFVSTPRNVQRLPKIPQDLKKLIDLVSLPLPKVENLPDQAESSMDLPHQKAQFLKIAFDLLRSQLAEFLESTRPKPDWIIYDYASYWIPSVASEMGISSAYFSLFTAAFMSFLGPPSVLMGDEDFRKKAEDFTVVPKWIPCQSKIVYHLHEIKQALEAGGEKESGLSDEKRFGISVDKSDLVLFRTSVEFEPDWFEFVCGIYQKPVVSVGVLPPLLEDDLWDDKNAEWLGYKEWLDKQKENSVIYVAFGSESALNQEQIETLALGLELCGLPFFWVLRKPPFSAPNWWDKLPEGFEERVKGRGVVCVGWVSQLKILSHPAIGGFLTHCGWNSVIEGLGFGRVLILFPVTNDQGLNARLLQEKKVGVEIQRDEQDGTFTADSVADLVKLAMLSEEGESIRSNARAAAELFSYNSRNDRRIESFIQYLVEMRKTCRPENISEL